MKSKFFLVLILVLCVAGLALAQSDTARIIGTITDPTGAVVSERHRHRDRNRNRTGGNRDKRALGPVHRQCFAHRKVPC